MYDVSGLITIIKKILIYIFFTRSYIIHLHSQTRCFQISQFYNKIKKKTDEVDEETYRYKDVNIANSFHRY